MRENHRRLRLELKSRLLLLSLLLWSTGASDTPFAFEKLCGKEAAIVAKWPNPTVDSLITPLHTIKAHLVLACLSLPNPTGTRTASRIRSLHVPAPLLITHICAGPENIQSTHTDKMSAYRVGSSDPTENYVTPDRASYSNYGLSWSTQQLVSWA